MKAAISIDGGKATVLNQRIVTVLRDALMAAIAGGREQTAMEITRKLGEIGGANGTVIQNCQFTDAG